MGSVVMVFGGVTLGKGQPKLKRIGIHSTPIFLCIALFCIHNVTY